MKPTHISWQLQVALLLVLSFCFMNYGIAPVFQWQESTLQQIVTLKRAVNRKRNLVDRADQMTEMLHKAMASLEHSKKYFFNGLPDVQALQLKAQKVIEQNALNNEVQITSTDWLFASEGAIVKAPLRMRCSAEFKSLMHFIFELEKNPHFFAIESINIRPMSKSNELMVEMEISAFGIIAGE